MLRTFLFILSAGLAASAASLSISPALITDCSNGLGKATLTWDNGSAATVQVRVGSREGTPFTGWAESPGSAETGYWVTNGMLFLLFDASGVELARVAAKLNCGGSPDPSDPAFAQGAYFPMQAGNRWTYRVNNRFATSTYVTWALARSELVGGRTYYVMTIDSGGSSPPPESRLRGDSDGRVYMLTNQGEQLWLDPTAQPDPSALFQIGRRGSFTGPLGGFPDALDYSRFASLSAERGTFVRGIGLAANRTDVLAGSSGGFDSSMELVDAQIGRALQLSTPASSLQVSSEATRLDVTGKKVTNCAVPCYFVACRLVPGADPPDTFKPCFQARVAVQHADANVVELELLDSLGRQLSRAARPLSGASATDATLLFYQVPLYSSPNVGLPPGTYRLVATIRVPGGETAGSATLVIRVD